MNAQVLVVEDNADLAALIALHLNDDGCDVHAAATVLDAKRRLDHQQFDLIVLDRMLPDGDGLEVCQRVRRSEDQVPVIISWVWNSVPMTI